MLILGLILSILAFAFCCWLLFNLAVYALPLFVAVTLGLAAYHHDAGFLGAFLMAILAGAVTLAIGRLAFALLASTPIRALIALLFATPAAIAGYAEISGFLHMGVVSAGWCAILAMIGAIFTGATAFARVAAFATPGVTGCTSHPNAPRAAGAWRSSPHRS